MARLPNTPRPPKLAARMPGPASVRAEAVVKRPPAPRAAAPRGDGNERPAKLRPAMARAPICDPPKRATPKERWPTLAPPKRATPKERAPTPAPPKRATPKERTPPKPPPRAAKPPPCPPKPPPCPPKPPPRASASSVKSGTARSNIATVQTPATDAGRLARDARAGVAAPLPRPRYHRWASCRAAACAAVGGALAYLHERRASNRDMGAFLESRRPSAEAPSTHLSWFSNDGAATGYGAPSMNLG